MRTIDYEEWKKHKRSLFRKAIALENIFEGHAPGRRPRDPEKERVFARLDLARKRRYIESGKLEIVGPRHWKWRIDFRKKTDS